MIHRRICYQLNSSEFTGLQEESAVESITADLEFGSVMVASSSWGRVRTEIHRKYKIRGWLDKRYRGIFVNVEGSEQCPLHSRTPLAGRSMPYLLR